MSQCTDWFVADPGDGETIATSDDPWSEWPSAQLRGIIQADIIELAELVGAQWDVELLCEDPLVLEIAPGLVRSIGNIADSEINELAKQWQQSEGLADREPAELSASLRQMRDLCFKALSEGKSVIELPAE